MAYLKDGNLTLLLDIRYPVTLTADAFLKKLTDRAGAAGFEVIHTADSAPYYMEKTHPFVRILMNAWRETTQKEGEPFVMGGGTYARPEGRTWELPLRRRSGVSGKYKTGGGDLYRCDQED